ncbi:MAG: TetR/AcrR family transcriptional regulator [Desulfobacterales bacterium]|nr:TetR/AcrR family transcriptional regulator [Desulfobacterales bacterium]MBS3754616.1 TetR/AcrR family transcriptional regulator [Desulfobacterales bacterium]
MALKTLEQLKVEEREARRKLIADTARELFAQKEFQEVTVREIAKAAGVSVGTIYNHYANLGELFLDVFLESGRQITRLMDKALEGNRPGAFRRVCRVYINYLNDNMTFFQMMSRFILGGGLSEEATPKLNQSMRSMMDRFENAVRMASIQTDTRISAHALFSALNGIMISYARYPGRTTEELKQHTLRLTDTVASIFESCDHANPGPEDLSMQ